MARPKKKNAKKPKRKPVASRTRAGKARINRAELKRRGAAMKRYANVLDGIVDRVHLAMEAGNYTVSWLSTCSFLCPGTIYRLLDGKTRFPQVRTLEHLADGLNVPIWWLVHGEDKPKFKGINQSAIRPKRRAA